MVYFLKCKESAPTADFAVYRFCKKAENALEWTGRVNNIRACAREVVNEEIIYT